MNKLPKVSLRRETDPNLESEIWQPSWKCFCCEDKGIAIHAAKMFIDGWELEKDKFPVCQNPGCEAGERFGASPSLADSLDWRLNGNLCKIAHQATRDSWREYARQKQRHFVDVSTIGKSLRNGIRTPTEEYEAQRKHSEARSR